MTIEITSWLRAFFALQQHAMDVRGCVEITTADDEIVRWPRTRASDVAAIAAVFGQADWLARAREHACEFADNREFWQALLARSVELHAQGTPVPSLETWTTLFGQLTAPDDALMRRREIST